LKTWSASWLFWALLSAFFAALTAIFAKIGVANINSDLATLFRTVVIAVVLAAILALTKQYQPLASISTPTYAFLAWQDLALLPGRSLLVSMRIHEPLELLPIPGVTEIFHEFREFALGGDELLAFFFQPREFSGAPFVEGAISSRAHAKTGGGLYRKAPAVGTARPVRPVSPFFSPEGNNVAGALTALPD
jgi:transporter family protein